MTLSKEEYLKTLPTRGRIIARRIGGGVEVAVSTALVGFVVFFNPWLAVVPAAGMIDGMRRIIKAEKRIVKRRGR